ncbi:MAG: insulinase family protein [Candidatus Nealsonbacteria bacterium]|nr:insulinase family protein [Candidatus Nealsonbacteria bacterium]
MKIIQKQLDNGLTVLLIPIDWVHTINECFAVGAGSRYEIKGTYGISHLLEHMAFEGTKKRPSARDFAAEIENRGGGNFNAATDSGSISYWCQLPIMSLTFSSRLINDIISDEILNSTMEKSVLEKEKGVIVQELYRKIDDPRDFTQGILWPRLLYGDHPLGQSGCGAKEDIPNISRKDILSYVKDLYVAPNSVVSLSGKMDVQRVLNDVDTCFGGLSPRLPKRKKPPYEERQNSPKLSLETRETSQTSIALGVKTHPIFCDSPDWAAVRLLDNVLGGKTSSRLYHEIRTKRGWAYEVETESSFYSDSGYFMAYAAVDKSKVLESIRIILKEFQKIASQGVSEKELKGAKANIAGGQKILLDDPLAIAKGVAEEFITSREVIDFEKRLNEFRIITPQDVKRVAEEIFTSERLNLAVLGPAQLEADKLYDILRI